MHSSPARSFTHDASTLVWDVVRTEQPRAADENTGAGASTDTGIEVDTDFNPGVGRVFVLVHGLGLGRAAFDGLAPVLAVHGRVIRVDLPGFGAAPEPPRVGSIEDSAQLLLALLDELGVHEAVLVGHSMGTQVVVEASVRRPALTRALVLIAPVVDPAATSTAVLFRRMARDMYNESPKVMATGLWLYSRAGISLYVRKLRMMLAYNTPLALPRVSAPVLVVRGEHDVVAPNAWCTDAAALAPDARLVEIPGRGHETFLNDPEPTATAIVAFVNEHAS